MNKLMIVWCLAAAVPVVIYVFALINKFRNASRRDNNGRWHFVEMGTDDEIFYCPGDERK